MHKKWIPLFTFIVIIISCSSPRMEIKSDYDPMAQFSDKKTFALMPGHAVKVDDPRVHNEFLNSRIQEALIRRLDKKGFEIKRSGEPDFWVVYDAVLSEGHKVRKVLSLDIRDLGDANEMKTYRIPYEKGTLILAMIDPRTQKPIWRGSAQAKIDMDVSWDEREKRIHRAVDQILKEFPPK